MKLNHKILKAINEGLRSSLILGDNILGDDEESSLLKRSPTDIEANSKFELEKEMALIEIIDLVENHLEESYDRILELYNIYSVLYNPHLDKYDFKDFITRCILAFGYECNLNWIDTSDVTDMFELFYDYFKPLRDFNGDISKWDVSNVKNMWGMFKHTIFNGDISKWDVSRVENMQSMFVKARFNLPIGNWDVSRVENMQSMFNGAYKFNQPIGNWNVSSVETMEDMFKGALSFNQPIGDWDVSRVENMSGMFFGASKFNYKISNWDVSNVQCVYCMFLGAENFNQNISNWDFSLLHINDVRIYDMFSKCPIKEEYKPKFN